MLERLERWTPLSVKRDDLAVDYCLVGLQPQACRRDLPVHPGEVLVLPRPKLDSLLVLDDQRPVAIELQLVDPVVALGEPLHDLRGHGRDERGACPLRCRGGFPSVVALASSSGWSWAPVERPMCYLDWFGTFTSNLIAASCSGAMPSLRRNGSQRGSEWRLSNIG